MSIIHYSQCWEDAGILREALQVEEDSVMLSVASAGDNALAVLPSRPRALVLIDKNPAQIHLSELKLKAPRVLTHGEYLELLGVSDVPRATREMQFEEVLPHLSPAAGDWLRRHSDLVASGIIHSGRFERYLRAFRRYVLPLVHSKDQISALLRFDDLEAQKAFYRDNWNTWRWRLFLRVAASRTLLRLFARQPGQDRGYEPERDANYGVRLESLVKRMPLSGNPYFHYCFAGEYGRALPDYLTPETYRCLAQASPESDVRLLPEDLHGHLRSMPADTYDRFNFSDVFESFSPEENDAIWHQILRVATRGARVVYWCNQVERHPPPALAGQILPETTLQTALAAKDRLFFYRSVNIRVVRK